MSKNYYKELIIYNVEKQYHFLTEKWKIENTCIGLLMKLHVLDCWMSFFWVSVLIVKYIQTLYCRKYI